MLDLVTHQVEITKKNVKAKEGNLVTLSLHWRRPWLVNSSSCFFSLFFLNKKK